MHALRFWLDIEFRREDVDTKTTPNDVLGG